MIAQVIGATIMREEKDGFRVCCLPGKRLAHLPFCHLSDYSEVQEIRKLAYKPRHKLDQLTLFSNSKQPVSFWTIYVCF